MKITHSVDLIQLLYLRTCILSHHHFEMVADSRYDSETLRFSEDIIDQILVACTDIEEKSLHKQ